MIPEKGVLWVARIGLLVSVLLHIWASMTLWRRAGGARTTRYAGKKKTSYGTFYAKAMRWGGLALLAFVVFHILHFTTQTITIDGAYASPAERVISSFSVWWAVLIYVAAMFFLGMHLLHGVWGAAMTLGLNTSLKRAEQIRFTAILVATVVVVGFLIRRCPSCSASSTDVIEERSMSDTLTETEPDQDSSLVNGLYREGAPVADSKAPGGDISETWTNRKFEAALVNPANRRKLSVIIVGTGLAGASAGATLGEAGYQVKSFCYHDSPRRAHSIAAQGGINAAKNYKGDGDSIHRLFYDTVKGGDYRSRESNVYRLAE